MASSSSAPSANAAILDVLGSLLDLYKKDPALKFKARALITSIANIKKYPEEIKSGAQAMNDIKGIGKGIADRIDEILSSGTLAELGVKNEKNETLSVLSSITGVGNVRAEEWYAAGLRTVADVHAAIAAKTITSTHHIDMGLKYYEDLTQRIPRAEIDKIKTQIKKLLKAIDPDLVFEICGSYRRGKAESGDIDLLVSNPKFVQEIAAQKYLQKIIEAFTSAGFIIDHLTEKGDKKYMGFCRLSPRKPARRIDIRVFDYVAFYAGVIYFTGSKEFNIEIRNKALAAGMSLNEYGFSKLDDKSKIFLKSEKELFEILGIPFVEPTAR